MESEVNELELVFQKAYSDLESIQYGWTMKSRLIILIHQTGKIQLYV